MSKEVRAGSVAAVVAGEPTLTHYGDKDIALFMCKGKVIATQGQCPHAQGPLHEGEVDGTVLTCPWHGWTFDLETGRCNEDDSIVLEMYRVRIEGDEVIVTP